HLPLMRRARLLPPAAADRAASSHHRASSHPADHWRRDRFQPHVARFFAIQTFNCVTRKNLLPERDIPREKRKPNANWSPEAKPLSCCTASQGFTYAGNGL